MSYEELLALFKAAGIPGLILAVVILVFVYAAKYGGLLKNGNWARAANFIIAILFAGVTVGDQQTAIVAAIGSTVAALLHEIFEALQKQVAARKKA